MNQNLFVRRIYGTIKEDVIYVLLLFFVLAVLACSEADAEVGEAGLVVGLSGSASITRPGQGRPTLLKQNDRISIADSIETGVDSRLQLLLSDGTVITLSQQCTARIAQYSFDTMSKRRTGVLHVKRGMLRMTLPERLHGESRFTIDTSHSRVVAHQADVVVTVTAEQTSIATLNGSVRVSNCSNVIVGSISLGVNQFTTVTPKQPPSAPSLLSQQQRRIYTKDARYF